MSAKSRTKSQKEKQERGPWEKIPATSSMYRYVPNGKFYMVARINGKLVRENLQTTDLALAKRKLLDTKDRRKTQAGEITLLSLAEEFKSSRNGKNQKHIDWMIGKLKSGCPFGDSLVRKINPLEIAKFITELNLNPRSNNLFFETLKACFEVGVIGGYIAFNPMEKLKRALRKKVTRKIPHIPSHEQFFKIVEVIRNQKYSDTAEDSANLVEFLGLAALGEAEAANLKWEDLDFDNNRMNIQRQKTKVYFQVPIYHHLKPLLEKMSKKSKTGTVFKVVNPKKAIKKATDLLGYPSFTARNFRQMGIVRLLRTPIDPKLVAKWQGHQDGGVLIMNTYSQVISDSDSGYEQEQLKRLIPVN